MATKKKSKKNSAKKSIKSSAKKSISKAVENIKNIRVKDVKTAGEAVSKSVKKGAIMSFKFAVDPKTLRIAALILAILVMSMLFVFGSLSFIEYDNILSIDKVFKRVFTKSGDIKNAEAASSSWSVSKYEYKSNGANMTVNDHYYDAKNQGYELASITSDDELRHLFREKIFPQISDSDCIIGGVTSYEFVSVEKCREAGSDNSEFCKADAGSSKYWKWLDGEPWGYTAWMTTNNRDEYPTDTSTAQCLAISLNWTGSGDSGRFESPVDSINMEAATGMLLSWKNIDCTERLPALYKKKK